MPKGLLIEPKLEIIIAIIIVIIAIIIMKIVDRKHEKKQEKYYYNQKIYYYNNVLKTQRNNNTQNNTINNKPIEQYPYHKKYLLTKNEYYFYKRLVSITDPLRLSILAKIRLADLIETNSNLNASEKTTYFNKIKSKHVDFAIANQMRIIMIIELDDSSHSNTIERDSFVNNALIKAGYTVVRTNGDMNVITKALIDKGFNANLYTNTNYYK